MIDRVNEVMGKLGLARKTPQGLPFAMYPVKDGNFFILLTVKYDDDQKILTFDAEPRNMCDADAKPIALDLMNELSKHLTLGHFTFRENDDGTCKVHCTAATYIADEMTVTEDLIRLLVQDSLSSLNSAKGVVNHPHEPPVA